MTSVTARACVVDEGVVDVTPRLFWRSVQIAADTDGEEDGGMLEEGVIVDDVDEVVGVEDMVQTLEYASNISRQLGVERQLCAPVQSYAPAPNSGLVWIINSINRSPTQTHFIATVCIPRTNATRASRPHLQLVLISMRRTNR